MDSMTRTAFVDESFRRGDDGLGYALLAAVIVPDAHAVDVEHALRFLVALGQRRFHWRDESASRQKTFLATVADLDRLEVVALAYCRETPSQKKLEQARVRCLWSLLADLSDRQVSTLVIESRQERNDRKDRREILRAQEAGVAARDLIYRHGRPKEEALLWLPDAMAGAVGLKIARDDEKFFSMLPDGMCTIRWIDRP